MSPDASAQPAHHPEPHDLLEYASGASPEWLSLMMACHLTLCPRCRDEVALLEDLGGALLELGAGAAPAVQPADDGWLERLTRATPLDRAHDGSAPHGTPTATRTLHLPDDVARYVPRPLHDYFAQSEVRWRWLGPGIRHVPLAPPTGPSTTAAPAQLRLVHFRPGYVIPAHDHAGLEWLLILDGDIGDSHTGARYGRGDVCASEPGKTHTQDVSKHEPCIALVANLGPLVPKTPLGRILASIVKI